LWSVSQDNTELARRGYEAFNRGDIEGFLEFIHPDVELDEGQDLPDRGIYQKHEGFLANVRAWSDVFDELRFEPEELIEVGDRLLVLVRVTGRRGGAVPSSTNAKRTSGLFETAKGFGSSSTRTGMRLRRQQV
jgi:ketosteroid isomerase-like protein